MPFARTRAEREARRDPRPSLEERYGTHDGYVRAVRAAAEAAVAQRFLLREDADRLIADAEKSDVLAVTAGAVAALHRRIQQEFRPSSMAAARPRMASSRRGGPSMITRRTSPSLPAAWLAAAARRPVSRAAAGTPVAPRSAASPPPVRRFPGQPLDLVRER